MIATAPRSRRSASNCGRRRACIADARRGCGRPLRNSTRCPPRCGSSRLKLGKPAVHIIDREADSVAHFRQWDRQKRLFLVRADNQRVVQHEGQHRTLPEVVALLHQRGAFRHSRTVLYHGQSAEQFVAATEVTLDRPARPQRVEGGGNRRSVRGQPLSVRLVVSEVRGPQGELLATWLLLINVPTTVSASEVALWYYWRWRVETDFKLLKSAGLHLEQWLQETALAVAKRLLVASMACVVVWGLAQRGARGGRRAAVAGTAEWPPDEAGL